MKMDISKNRSSCNSGGKSKNHADWLKDNDKTNASSFSKQSVDSYSKKISEDAFKESGAIEYTADILIGLQFEGQDNTQDFDLTKAKSEQPRKIELVILKNRSGEIGKKVCYSYYPMFNLFEEE